MTSGAEFPNIPKSELLGRMAEGHAARVSVVTPNLRLAAAVRRDFDAQQIANGLAVWEAADILPLSAFVERLYQDALYSELATELPILLTGAQEQALWEDTVRSSEAGAALLSAPPAAALAREAWQLAHAWRLLPRLKGYPASDDARAFADWAWRYEGITRRDRHCDRARLAEVVIPHLAHAALAKPATLVAYGFDILTAQQREFLAALARTGVTLLACGPQPREAVAHRVAFNSAREEIRAAASWARARLEADAHARIGIVVPDLAQSRNAVQRIFAQVMEPAHRLPPLQRAPGIDGSARDLSAQTRPLPFNISLGEPLSSYPLVAAALLVLDIARSAASGDLEFSRASSLTRSPFIAGAETELGPRARLDAQLRRVAGPKISLERLRRAIGEITAPDNAYRVPACPLLAHRLGELAKFAREYLRGAKRPGEWGKVIAALLDALGFPGERTLDSAEYQTLKKFHEAIAGFAALDRVAGRMRFSDASARLARIAADTLFQPEAPEVPIQVLGVLESAGMEFDHLWVMGLTDEAWPLPAQPNPFIPVALQRAAGVPESSAAASLELDARITRGWLAAADEVLLSHPLREGDRELVPSPLIRDVPESKAVPLSPGPSPAGGEGSTAGEDLALPEYGSLREAIRRARREERTPDECGPALAVPSTSPGGTGVFKDQAACPFRAFALHRLHADALEEPPTGLDALERGNLVHAALAHLWQQLRSKARLDGMSAEDLDTLLEIAADNAIVRLRRRRPEAIEGRFAALEKTRLVKLGRAWIEIEKERPPFEVQAVEQKRAVGFGGVTVNARLDRMDRLLPAGPGPGQGGYAIIDYKTGAASVGDWLGPRPGDPQLPLYAVSRDEGEAIAAVAYARVKAGDMEFKGVAREEGLIPGVKSLAGQRIQAARDYASWEELLAGWRYELEALGKEFAAGAARVEPKRGDETCRYCELKPLCRINERAFSVGSQDE